MLAEAAEAFDREVEETKFRWDGDIPTIEGPYATLEIHDLHEINLSDDSALAFGEIVAGNRRGARNQSLASLVYEEVESGRYGWVVYRLQKQAPVLGYPLGPSDREHGLAADPFFLRRSEIERGASGSFTARKQTLTVDVLEELYVEAMDLPGPSPQ